MLTLYILASGSEGNCLLLCGEQTHILIDAGISCRRIVSSLAALGLNAADLSAVLITHEHSDHICGLSTLVRRYAIPLYASAATGRQLIWRIAGAEPLLHTVPGEGAFRVGELRITAFPTSHDAADSVGYRVDCGGDAVGVLTDTGYVTDEAAQTLRGAALLVLESNHDVERLRAGPYPYPLKRRILSDRGHLSNDAAACFAAQMAASGTRQIVLAHLSRENNTPALALQAVRRAVSGYDVSVSAAPRDTLSGPYTAEVALCRR